MTDAEPNRWRYRFERYGRALAQLIEAVKRLEDETLDQLGKEGLVQRFEFTFELAWKVLNDYLRYGGQQVPALPRSVIRAAFASGLIEDGDAWIDALKARNLSSHVYDLETVTRIVREVQARHLSLFIQLKERLDTIEQ